MVGTSPRLQELIASKRPGDEVRITVKRNGKEKEFDVVLENANGTTDIVKREKKEVLNLLGADFETLNSELAEKLDLDGGVQVTRLYPGKIRKQTQMRESFIITHIDGKKVKDVEDVAKALDGKSGGVMIQGRYEESSDTFYYAFGMDS